MGDRQCLSGDAFVAEVAGWESVDLQTLSEFLMVASTLVELKSRRLLPGPDEVETDEELVGWEERDLLLARLLECQAYAAAADGFAILLEQAARSVPRTAGLDLDFVVDAPDLLEGVTPDDAGGGLPAGHGRAAGTGGGPLPRHGGHGHRGRHRGRAGPATAPHGSLTFRELTGHLTSRMEIIVSFLALLELCKQGRVALDQGHTFGDLEVVWLAGDREPVSVATGLYDEYEG